MTCTTTVRPRDGFLLRAKRALYRIKPRRSPTPTSPLEQALASKLSPAAVDSTISSSSQSSLPESPTLTPPKRPSILETPPATPPRRLRYSRQRSDMVRRLTGTITGSGTRARVKSVMNDNEALRARLSELEMTEIQNSTLKSQVDDLQRALDEVQEDQRRVNEDVLHMAYFENESLRERVSTLQRELSNTHVQGWRHSVCGGVVRSAQDDDWEEAANRQKEDVIVYDPHGVLD